MKEMDVPEAYLRWLEERREELDRQARAKGERGEAFEAVLDWIRSNVTGICRTMFSHACHGLSPAPLWDREIQDLLARAASPQEGVDAVYRLILGRVSHAWETGLREAREEGDLEEEIKARVKREALEAALTRLAELRRHES